MSLYDKKVGEVIRVEYNQETGELRVILDITDQAFKMNILHNKEYADLIKIKGKDAIASKEGE